MMQDGFVALCAAVMKFWERLSAILCLNAAHGKDFARKMGKFLESLENPKGQSGSTGCKRDSTGCKRETAGDGGQSGSINFRNVREYRSKIESGNCAGISSKENRA